MYPKASSSLANAVPAPDDLISGNIRTQPFELAVGTYVRGQVLEWDAANGRMQALATASNAQVVVVEDITLSAPQTLPVYIAGDFNEEALEIGSADLTAVKAALSARGIMARKWGAAPDTV